ncbi:MAG TPA: OmpW family outer membrane protein [Gemmatimonadaceae bacterium]|nr:OmpW family outer membrane protein [Gemmatimonadaceae bacterium]
MRRPGKALRLAALASAIAASAGQAQGGIALGYTDIGAVLGIGGVGEASFALGGRFEKVIKPLPDLGDGLLGIQVGADWWSWDFGSGYSVSYIPIGVTANYHFKMENKKIDPFLGAGLGYQLVNASCPSFQGVDPCGSYSSGIYFITKAGIRYFLNTNMALYADIGVGAATLNVGAVWKIK